MKDTTQSAERPAGAPCRHGVCPWYLGYLLANPLRRLLESPEKLLGPFVRPGMTVLEPGSGMGFYSLPLARMVGPTGRVICVDLQPEMIAGLRRRARRAGLLDRLETVVCSPGDLGIDAWKDRVDLALALHVVHEVPDADGFLRQIASALRAGGSLLVVEPRGHVTPPDFAQTIAAAERVGLAPHPAALQDARGLVALFSKQNGQAARR